MEALVILIVDDDKLVRGAVTRVLSGDSRVRVIAAADGIEALKILEREAVDVVISDHEMPGMSGVRLLETIRAQWPGAQRVLFTGNRDGQVVLDAVNRGGVHRVLIKGGGGSPVEELRELVDECLAIRTGRPTAVSSIPAPAGARSRVLVVLDELALQSRYEAALRTHEVRFATTSKAVAAHKERAADAIVLDLCGPADPARFMRDLREQDLDCPVIVAAPRDGIERAHEAMRYGAYRYLLHPFSEDSLLSVIRQAISLQRVVQLRREAVEAESGAFQLGDRAALEIGFRRALEQLFIVYQPIVSLSKRNNVGFEALVRSREPTLPHPGALFDAANRLDRVEELGRAIRRLAVEPWRGRKGDELLFLNLDMKDLNQDDLASDAIVSLSDRIVLEITERAALDSVDGAATAIAGLRARGFRIAVDDLGAGYAGLTSFATLEPDIVKLDMTLVRNIHNAPVKQRLVAGLQQACDDLKVRMVAEGVETVEELRALTAAGCDIFQGFLFARPGPAFPSVTWP